MLPKRFNPNFEWWIPVLAKSCRGDVELLRSAVKCSEVEVRVEVQVEVQ